jgi:hypothetical protein
MLAPSPRARNDGLIARMLRSRAIRSRSIAAIAGAIGLGAFAPAAAIADVPPSPEWLSKWKDVSYSFSVAGLEKAPDYVLVAKSCGRQYGPILHWDLIEYAAGKGGCAPLFAIRRADLAEWRSMSFNPEHPQASQAIDALLDGPLVHRCEAQPQPIGVLAKSDPRDVIVETLEVVKIDETGCELRSNAPAGGWATEPSANAATNAHGCAACAIASSEERAERGWAAVACLVGISMFVARRWSLGLSVGSGFFFGCSPSKDDASATSAVVRSPPPTVPASTGTAAPASAAPSLSAVATAPFEAAKIPAGDLGPVHTEAFEIRRFAGDTDKNLLEAGLFCHEHEKTLCTSTQWKRAAAIDPSVADIESWTGTWEGNQVIVAGKKLGDGAPIDPTAHDASRATLCCDAAPAWIQRRDHNFQAIAQKALTRYTKALDERDIGELDKIFGLGLWLDQDIVAPAKLSHPMAIAAQRSWFTAHPKQWNVYDTCAAGVGLVPDEIGAARPTNDGIVVRCTAMLGLEKELTFAKQELGWSKLVPADPPELVMIRHASRDRHAF